MEVDENNTGVPKLREKMSNKRMEKKEQRDAGDGKQVMSNPCKGRKCQNDSLSICDDHRQLLFNEYYKFQSYEQKKNWLLNCMHESEVKRKRTNREESRRSKTIRYKVVIFGY